ncbi:MAG: hypothetical protein ACLQVK_15395, partial [Acidimicrobiales bacterium]
MRRVAPARGLAWSGSKTRAPNRLRLFQTLPLVPGLVERLRGGSDVADVGCGSGHAADLTVRAFLPVASLAWTFLTRPWSRPGSKPPG